MKNVWWSNQGDILYIHVIDSIKKTNHTYDVFNYVKGSCVIYAFLQGSQIQQRQKQTKSECWCENVVFTSSRILVWQTLLGQMCVYSARSSVFCMILFVFSCVSVFLYKN